MSSQNQNTETSPQVAPIRVLVAESSRAIREFLAAMLAESDAIELVGACSDLAGLELALATEQMDVLVTDVRMPPSQGDEGIRIARRLRENDRPIGVVLLSQYAEPAYVLSLLESGSARAYLLTERLSEKDELVDAIEAVAAGGIVVDPRMVESLIEARARVARSPLPRLDRGERELLALIVEGKRDAVIASSLDLSERSVAARVGAVLQKLDLPWADDAGRRAQDVLAYLAEEGD
ncbi:MAG TPA: response regulator transcription factor [Solirubrobacteraceae bacterium]|jgi:DNA-binding NarL/FixJ family response regulator|nr:response regulator transcription factor [Solirubrobacteraceae bacterium]